MLLFKVRRYTLNAGIRIRNISIESKWCCWNIIIIRTTWNSSVNSYSFLFLTYIFHLDPPRMLTTSLARARHMKSFKKIWRPDSPYVFLFFIFFFFVLFLFVFDSRTLSPSLSLSPYGKFMWMNSNAGALWYISRCMLLDFQRLKCIFV